MCIGGSAHACVCVCVCVPVCVCACICACVLETLCLRARGPPIGCILLEALLRVPLLPACGGACRWLEGLCTVLNRIVDAHEKRGAPHTATALWQTLVLPEGWTGSQ